VRSYRITGEELQGTGLLATQRTPSYFVTGRQHGEPLHIMPVMSRSGGIVLDKVWHLKAREDV
jgi:hypothetical protein